MSSVPPVYAPLDSVPGELGRVTRADVVAEARTWLETPYVHQHRAKSVAVDCAGLVIGVARELALVSADFDITGYGRSPDGKSLVETCDRFMSRVRLGDLKPGHVVVIRWERDPQHMGILGDYLIGGLSLIHALGTVDGKGRVVEHRLNAQTLAKVIRGYALPGVQS